VYLDWFKDKATREKELENTPNDTNIFTKNLLKDVTKEQLIAAFKVYG